MRNPWTKKNPLMSMWLSAANRSAGAVRGQATAAAKREIAKAQKDGMRDMFAAFTGKSTSGSAKKKSRR